MSRILSVDLQILRIHHCPRQGNDRIEASSCADCLDKGPSVYATPGPGKYHKAAQCWALPRGRH